MAPTVTLACRRPLSYGVVVRIEEAYIKGDIKHHPISHRNLKYSNAGRFMAPVGCLSLELCPLIIT